MPKEDSLKEKAAGSKQTETNTITSREESMLLKFREDVIKKIPLVMSFNKADK